MIWSGCGARPGGRSTDRRLAPAPYPTDEKAGICRAERALHFYSFLCIGNVDKMLAKLQI